MTKNNKLNYNLSEKGIVLFDGYCNLCSWSVQFILKRDDKDFFRFASLQSEIAQKLLYKFNLPKNFDQSVILIEKDKIYFKSDAALRITKWLNRYWKYLFYLIYLPRFIRDFVYDIVARNRFKWFGKKDSCFVPGEDINTKFL